MVARAARGGASRATGPAPGKRIEVPIKKAGSGIEDKLHTWPFLVRSEFLMSIAIIVVLTIWSLTINAPLEGPANTTRTPNPSKAPWYFLGLQEMLVFFDPWYAGVVLPSFVIVGLMLIPFLDINPKGNGYYTFKERRFEILTFLLGFQALWVVLHHHRDLFPRPRMELVLARAGVGSASGGIADQRRFALPVGLP